MQVTVESCSHSGNRENSADIRDIGNTRNRGIKMNSGNRGNSIDIRDIGDIGDIGNTGNTVNTRNTGRIRNIRSIGNSGNIGSRGSITVEASIIVPLVILTIAAAIYIGLLLYQRALIQSAAEQAAEAGAMAWVTGTLELRTGKPMDGSFENFALYRRLYDSEYQYRLECIEQYALASAGQHELVKSVNTNVEAVVKEYVVCRKMEVTIRKEYSLPFGKFLKLFGGSDTVDMTVKAVSAIDEPMEFIRTTDFIIDIEKKLENQFPELKDFGDKTRDALSEIKGRLEGFME